MISLFRTAELAADDNAFVSELAALLIVDFPIAGWLRFDAVSEETRLPDGLAVFGFGVDDGTVFLDVVKT